MNRSPKFKSWGDPLLDRLWREMYESEKILDDFDLVTDSPRLKIAEQAAIKFREALQARERRVVAR